MTPATRSVHPSGVLRWAAAVAVLVAVPLVLAQPAGAAGSFVPVGGNQVQITFASQNSSSATVWTFTFTGAIPQSGSCPSGGTLAVDVGGNPNEAECTFPAVTSSGVVTITLDTTYACTSEIADQVGTPGNLVSDPPITCVAGQTTTTNPTGQTTTTVAATTTTVPASTTTVATTTTTAATTTTTTTPGPCQCDHVALTLSTRGVSVAHVSGAGSRGTQSRLRLTISWAIDCTGGVGQCSSRIVVLGASGGSTTLYRTLPTSGGGAKLAHLEPRIRSKPKLAITCGGPCGDYTTGRFYVQWTTTSSLSSRSLSFAFETTCSGQTTTHTMTLVFNAGGAFDAHKSTLGRGRAG